MVEMATGGVINERGLQGLEQGCVRNGEFMCGESPFMAMLAGQRGVVVQGGEPLPPELNQGIRRRSSNEDLLVYRSTLAVLNLQRQRVPVSEWPSRFGDELARDGITLGGEDAWSYSRYEQWLSRNLRATAQQVEDRWIEPRNDSAASPLQRISYRVDQAREPMILERAESMLNQHQRSMMIYGAGHYFKQSEVLQRALGSPQIECLAGN
jgi:hypothetical protein